MKFFIDTANIEDIRTAASWGIVDGVTTNPSLMSKEKGKFEDILKEICDIVNGPVSAEAVSPDAEGMAKEGQQLSKIHENIIIKIPMTVEGMKAVQVLEPQGIRTNVTLVFSANQALLAAKAGASFVSPFIGRIDDSSHVGMELIEEIMMIYTNYDYPTEVIVASVRNVLHVLEAAMIGADIATIPFGVMKQMYKHPLTDIGMEKFLADWEKFKKAGGV
jgi:transaldolase